jgi:hypothetical protein
VILRDVYLVRVPDAGRLRNMKQLQAVNREFASFLSDSENIARTAPIHIIAAPASTVSATDLDLRKPGLCAAFRLSQLL